MTAHQDDIKPLVTRLEASRRSPELRLVAGSEMDVAIGEGALLRAAREEKSLTAAQMARRLHLRTDQIAAIEAMDFERMPGLGYAMGYVRSYVEALELTNSEQIVEAYRLAWSPIQNAQEKKRATIDSRIAIPFLALIALGFGGWLLFWASINLIAGPADEPITAPDASIEHWASQKPALPAQVQADVEPESWLTAHRAVRVELRGADGALVIDREMAAGERISTDGLGRYFVSTNDGGALTASGFGKSQTLGGNHEKLDWWRVPDFAAMAEAERVAEAQAAAAAAATAAGQTVPAAGADATATAASAPNGASNLAAANSAPMPAVNPAANSATNSGLTPVSTTAAPVSAPVAQRVSTAPIH